MTSLLISSLACWYVVHTFNNSRGPFALFTRVRMLGTRRNGTKRGDIHYLLHCPLCQSFWVGLLLTINPNNPPLWIMQALATAGGGIFISYIIHALEGHHVDS